MAPVAGETVHDGPKKHVVFVVGLGMVGIAFIEKLLDMDQDKKYKIVTCGEETHLAYNRVGLTEYFQHRSVENLYLNTPEWYSQHEPDRFEFHTGEQVTHVDVEAHQVKTSLGKTYNYDTCVLATGSGAGLPPYISEERAKKTKGVFVYRNISDLEAIIDYADQDHVTRATVVGGGLLGLEAAKAVYDLPTIPDVSIINRSGYPLSRQLDSEAGEMVLRKIEAMGVQCLTNISVKDITVKEEQHEEGHETFNGFEFRNGEFMESDMVIFAIGIKARDDLARTSGIDCYSKGGVVVADDLSTSAKDVYAIGECASWRGNTYGLIAPGVEMADILAFNMTQTSTAIGTHEPRKMNNPDLSTKLKLMGVDVASFGDFFADTRMNEKVSKTETSKVSGPSGADNPPVPQSEYPKNPEASVSIVDEKPSANGAKVESTTGPAPKRHHKRTETVRDEPIKCLTYKDPFGSVYKKYIFTADGKYLLGGMMIGDVADFVKLVAIVKKKKALEMPPSEFIIGAKSGGADDGADLDDDTQICSCHNVCKGQVVTCVKGGCSTIGEVKSKTKAGTGCGGCMSLVQNIFNAEMKKAGHEISTALCSHFKQSRKDLFSIVRIKKYQDFQTVMKNCGTNPTALGCEICKPAIGSILSSLFNEHILKPKHHQLQDTNDKYLANVQRNGTFSVIPRVTAGEITPERLIVLGQVAKKYGLYTKITGGQRIDLFGAQKQDLPDIWAELVAAGFESGHAYGKSLRTVKSCVGTSWCRYGIGDSVGLAVQLENRYRGVRSPHKFKGGVSGCVRECAEAQSKDFGLIATDKGWNIFLGGNGGATPRHATLFAQDVPPHKVVRILDRFLMFYIRDADRLMRTARWVEQFEGGFDKLKRILLDDELGICADLEKEMDELVGTFECEWTKVVNDPGAKKRFRQFVNTDERVPNSEIIKERGQNRPADWPKNFPPKRFNYDEIASPKDQWKWVKMAKVDDLAPNQEATTSAVTKYGDVQLAIFHVPGRGYYATQQMCPHKRAFILDHGLVGDDPNGNLYVSCPLHKRNFKLDDGECMNDSEYKILSFDVKEEGSDLLLLLPTIDELEAVLGTSKWMVKQAASEALGRGSAGQIEFIGPNGQIAQEEREKSANVAGGGAASPDAACTEESGSGGCGPHKLEW